MQRLPKYSKFNLASMVLLLTLPLAAIAKAPPVAAPKQYAVASAHPLATQAGMDTLAAGGNAFDAAITVAAMLSVVEPYSAGMGGGGFWMLHQANSGKTVMLDAREKAPGAAHRDMFLDQDKKVDRDKAINTGLSAGIPGQAAAFVHLSEHYGKRPLKDNLAPAIRVATQGFPSNEVYFNLAQFRQSVLQRYPESARIFLKNGTPIPPGEQIVQKDLAATLTSLAQKGFSGFYKGEVAKKLVAGVTAAGGIWTLQDLANYQVVERKPIQFNYGDAVIWSAPPPSSGGIALAEMFGMLEQYPATPADSPQRIHALVEMMRRAYRDRALYLGDSDFVKIPVEKLMNKSYLAQLSQSIQPDQATASASLGPGVDSSQGTHTTHFSIIDRAGNQVAATLSINLPFGSAVTAPGTGVLLNNEMDDFSAQPGSPNAYGLIGSEANAIAGNKRPLSSMTPTFMEYGPADNRQRAIIGTPGGSRIITMVFLGMLEALADKPPQAWVDKARFHHQYYPDVIQIEPGAFSEIEAAFLTKQGHQIKDVGRHYGDMHGIRWNMKTGEVEAASDRRRLGQAQTGSQSKP